MVTIDVLLLVLLASAVVALADFLMSLLAGGRGSRFAGRALGTALAAGFSLLVVGVAAELTDLGLS